VGEHHAAAVEQDLALSIMDGFSVPYAPAQRRTLRLENQPLWRTQCRLQVHVCAFADCRYNGVGGVNSPAAQLQLEGRNIPGERARGAADNPDIGGGGELDVFVGLHSKALRDERQQREDGDEQANHALMSW